MSFWTNVSKEIVKAAGIALVAVIGAAIGGIVADKIKKTQKKPAPKRAKAKKK